MTISTPYVIGNVQADSVTSAAVSPAAATNTGDLIVVCTDAFSPSGGGGGFPGTISSVVDSAGNSYIEVTGGYTAAPQASVWYAQNTTALTTSSTITVTWTISAQINVTVIGCSGIATGNSLDQAATNFTIAAQMSVSTGNLALNSELAIASWVSRQAQGAPSLTSDWNSLAAFQGAANTHWDNVAYKIATTAVPVTASASTPSSGLGWAVTLVTFRGQIHPTAELTFGGSAAGYPVRTVDATALLGCGGSIEQFGTLGLFFPYEPPPLAVFPAGYGPQQADFANWVQNSFGYLTGLSVFRAQQQVSQSLASGTYTPVSFDTILEDNFDGWSSVPGDSQPANSWLAPFTGWFRVTFQFSVPSGSRWLVPAVSVTGGFPQAEAGGVETVSGQSGGAGCSVIVPMIGETDYIQFLAWTSASTTTDVASAGLYSFCEIVPVQTDLAG